MKYLGAILGRIMVAVVFFGIFMAGVIGAFDSSVLNVFFIIGGIGGIAGSIWAIVTKHDKKEIDADEQAQAVYNQKQMIQKAVAIKEQEAIVSQGDYRSEALRAAKAILVEIPPPIGRMTYEVWLNDLLVGTIDAKNRKLRFTTSLTKNYLYIVNQQTQEKSRYCFFEVISNEGEGYIGYMKSLADDVYTVKKRSGLVRETPQ